MTILFSIMGVLFVLLVIVFVINLYANAPTKGTHIPRYTSPKSALLVIDMQNDITSNASYKNVPDFVENVNKSIAFAEEKGMEILYVKMEISNPFVRLLGGGKYKKGTEGAMFDKRLHLASQNIYSKSRGDSFSTPELENFLASKNVDKLYLVGADTAGCVLRTAQGARNRNYSVNIIRDAVASILNDAKIKQIEALYQKDGVGMLRLAEL